MTDADQYYMHEFDLDEDLKKPKKSRKYIATLHQTDTRGNESNADYGVNDNDPNTSFDPTINMAYLDPTENVADPSASSMAAAAAAAAAAASGRPSFRKRVNLDTDKLLDPEKGLDYVMKNARKRIRISKQNSTLDNLSSITQFYQLWAHNLYPKAKFKDFLLMAENLGNQIEIKSYRRDLYTKELEEGIDTKKYDKNVHDTNPTESNENQNNNAFIPQSKGLFVEDKTSAIPADSLGVVDYRKHESESSFDLVEQIAAFAGAFSNKQKLEKDCHNLVEKSVTDHIGSEKFFGVNISKKYYDLFEQLGKHELLTKEMKIEIKNVMLGAVPSSYLNMLNILIENGNTWCNLEGNDSTVSEFVDLPVHQTPKGIDHSKTGKNKENEVSAQITYNDNNDDENDDDDDELISAYSQKLPNNESATPQANTQPQDNSAENRFPVEEQYGEEEEDEMALMREFDI